MDCFLPLRGYVPYLITSDYYLFSLNMPSTFFVNISFEDLYDYGISVIFW